MTKPTAAERAYLRLSAEQNPGDLRDAVAGVARIVRDMKPRTREILQEEIASEQITEASQPTRAADADAFLSAPDLARKYGVEPNRLAKRLERWRAKNREDWREIEASERGPREPQYLYREAAVKALIGVI